MGDPVGGALVVLLGEFFPKEGDEFDILDWGGALEGRFDSLRLPDLGPALAWDTGGLYERGVLRVVPEPASLALLGLGAAGLVLRRRKR